MKKTLLIITAIALCAIVKAQNVGIGTNAPDQLLTISAADNPVFRLDRSGSGKHDWEIYTQSGGALQFRGGADGVGGSLTDFLTIASDGDVGIGTIAPSTKLHVVGGARITGLSGANAVVTTDANGVLGSTPLSGNANHVYNGTGAFVDASTLSTSQNLA